LAKHRSAHPPLLDGSDARDNIGGYEDYPELYTRWFEYGSFLPIFRTHGSRLYKEVWTYGKAAEPILEKYLKLRYQLMPYIYSLGYRTYESGAPYMRALFIDFPDDPNVAGMGDEYMFGPAIPVAPVTEQGATSHSVYLPAGADWYNYWTNQRIRGGQTIKVRAPIDTLPLFVRAGSIVPLGEPVERTSETQKLARVRVYRGADGDFTLYDDDGKTYAYEGGDRKTTRLHWNNATAASATKGSRRGLVPTLEFWKLSDARAPQIPRCRAATAACVRSVTLSLANRMFKCHFTVPTVIFSFAAISLLVNPFTINPSISASRALRSELGMRLASDSCTAFGRYCRPAWTLRTASSSSSCAIPLRR
jgi:hypothetical protein